jgi:DNA polymerase III epsilon subunit-like protein
MNRIYLDIETTGLDSDNSIIEIAAFHYKGNELISQFSDTGRDTKSVVNLDALRVNKYNFNSLANIYKSEEQLLMNFFNWLLKIDSKPDLAGINIQFDYNLIKERAKKYNIVVGSLLPYRLHDITNISRFLTKIGLLNIKSSGSGNSLKDLATALNITFNEEILHSAVGDVSLYYEVDSKLEQVAKEAMCRCKV